MELLLLMGIASIAIYLLGTRLQNLSDARRPRSNYHQNGGE